MPLRVIKSLPFLSFQWSLQPMPSPRRSGIMGVLAPTLDPRTLLVGYGKPSIVVDPVVSQLDLQEAFQEGLRKV